MDKIFIIGTIFICLVGTLLHFLYEMTSHNKIISLFAAVNESTWEHIKIALSPYFLWMMVDGLYYGTNGNYPLAKMLGALVIIILIPTLFYGYQIFTKKAVLFIDIIIFYVSIFLSEYVGFKVLNLAPVSFYYNYISFIILFLIFGFYMVVTLNPIKNFLFKDPITNNYGIKGHSHHNHKEKEK